MEKILRENFPLIAILLICLIYLIRVVTGTKNTVMREYGKMTEEEKELYDISKVKMSQILCILSIIIVIVLDFVFTKFFPDIIAPNTFTVCLLVEMVVTIIFFKTKWIINFFCKKKNA
ncbi:hypothetical protein [Lachnoclostridium phytofermentans]|uniref:DUF3784 domain-containing protein n=1 Tax=Lachnoclostridium phytofermentans (strain ATCC 700394 / DSM 18823 / ISDg) TaxID=357809 RepID=A9KSA7_LACP7|nr:hypothetical protein [Lachnoclostridium phytofermentans]ABX42139.1 hypothetical protein Cphy_1767 [Lachnoclostridium phytofermentans ISDg]